MLTATFTVTATNATAYQWRFNGALLAGATNATLTLANARPSDSGAYSVLVGDSYGSVLSRNAGLKVLWTRSFWGLGRGRDGRVQLSFEPTVAGAAPFAPQFYVEFTTNLVDWTALTNACVVTNGQVMFDEGATNAGPHRFYRVLER